MPHDIQVKPTLPVVQVKRVTSAMALRWQYVYSSKPGTVHSAVI